MWQACGLIQNLVVFNEISKKHHYLNSKGILASHSLFILRGVLEFDPSIFSLKNAVFMEIFCATNCQKLFKENLNGLEIYQLNCG